MASAARKDFERLEHLASASKRCFVFASIRIERVSLIVCVRLYTFSHNTKTGCLRVERWVAGGAGFPAAVDPEPLVRVFANGVFDRLLDGGGVGFDVAGDGDLGIEVQNVALLLSGPEGESGDDAGSAAGCDFGEGGAAAGGFSEEIDEGAGFGDHVLVDQNAYRLRCGAALAGWAGRSRVC